MCATADTTRLELNRERAAVEVVVRCPRDVRVEHLRAGLEDHRVSVTFEIDLAVGQAGIVC